MSRKDLLNEELAAIRARYAVRWLSRHGLALKSLDWQESAALFERANEIARRYVRRFGGAR